MKPEEHIAQADHYLASAAALSTRYGVCVEAIPACEVLAALALAHATTATAQLMATQPASLTNC